MQLRAHQARAACTGRRAFLPKATAAPAELPALGLGAVQPPPQVQPRPAGPPKVNAAAAKIAGGDRVLVRKLTEHDNKARMAQPFGPLMLPVVGESFELFEKGYLRFGLERYLQWGPVFRTSYVGNNVIMICCPDLYKAMMAKDNEVVFFDMFGSFAKMQTEYARKTMANLNGERLPFRRTMLPAITQDALAGYVPKMLDISKRTVDDWASGPSFDVGEQSRRIAMEFANQLLAGLDIKDEAEAKVLRDDLAVYFDGMMTYDIDLPGTPLRKALHARERLHKRVMVAVAKQLEEILKDPVPAVPGAKARKNMFGYVIDSRRADGMSVDVSEMAYLALGVLQAGTDTSSAGLACLLGVLVQRPDLWEKLRAEQVAAIDKHGAQITKGALDTCKLLDACVREAMRFMPPGTVQFRKALCDFELGGYLVRKDDLILVNVSVCQALEQDPNWVVRAKMARAEGKPMPIPFGADIERIGKDYDPYRWIDCDPSNRPNMLTFGYGPHTCVGMAVFVQEAKVMLAYMLRTCDLQLAGDLVRWVDMPLGKPAPGTRLTLKPLDTPLPVAP